MRHIYLLILIALPFSIACAQSDTLAYDGINSLTDGQLVALTKFDGDLDVFFTTRFSPVEKCWLKGIILGFSLVKMQPLSGDDSVEVLVYENTPVPPTLTNVVKTYKIPLGATGFPAGNVAYTDPFSSFDRDQMYLPLAPPVTFSPKRDFIVGVKAIGKQNWRFEQSKADWKGMAVLMKKLSPNASRYGRYIIGPNAGSTKIEQPIAGNDASMYMRADVVYDSTLPPTILATVAGPTTPIAMTLEENYPNPFTDYTFITFTLAGKQQVTIGVFDALGRKIETIADGAFEAGGHRLPFAPGPSVPPGLYIVRMTAASATVTRSMILQR